MPKSRQRERTAPRTLTEDRFRKIDHLTERLSMASEKQMHERCGTLLLREVLLEIERESSGVGLSLKAVTPMPKTQELETLLIALMLERELYASGSIKELGILRKVGHGFAVDGLQSMISGAESLRTLIVTDAKLCAYFTHVLDLGKISEHCHELGLDSSEDTDRWNRRVLRVGGSSSQWGFTVGQIYASFEHSLFGKATQESFDESLTRFIEFVCLLDYKPGWAVGTSLVRINDYQPLYKILTPGMFGSTMSNLLETAYTSAIEGKLDSTKQFHESRRSETERRYGGRGRDQRTFVIDREFTPLHVRYVTIKEDSKCIAVGFDCGLDFERLERFLGERGFRVVRESGLACNSQIANKGTRFDIRKRFSHVDKRTVQDEDGNEIVVFRGANQALVFPKNADAMKKAGLVLNTLYNNMLFCTPILRDAEYGDSGLSAEERAVIGSFDTLVTLYRFFLEPVDGRIFRERLERGDNAGLRSPLESVMSMLQDVAGGFEDRVLHVLSAMDARINPAKFIELYGAGAETQEKAGRYYARLRLLLEQFGQLVGSPAATDAEDAHTLK